MPPYALPHDDLMMPAYTSGQPPNARQIQTPVAHKIATLTSPATTAPITSRTTSARVFGRSSFMAPKLGQQPLISRPLHLAGVERQRAVDLISYRDPLVPDSCPVRGPVDREHG